MHATSIFLTQVLTAPVNIETNQILDNKRDFPDNKLLLELFTVVHAHNVKPGAYCI